MGRRKPPFFFILPCVAAGARIKLAVPCQLVLFDPTLLICEKKRGVEPPRRSCFLRWRVNTQGSADPCAIPVVLIKQRLPCRALLRFLPALSLWSAIANRFAVRTTIRLPSSRFGSLRRRKAFLLCKNPCGGTARAKKFPEEICFAPSRV